MTQDKDLTSKKEVLANIRKTEQLVGNKIKSKRLILGYSQAFIANKLGVSVQQMQKYERGQNRISSGRLYSLSMILKSPINYFFTDEETLGECIEEQSLENQELEKDFKDLVIAFAKIQNEVLRIRLIHFIRGLSSIGL